MTREFNGIYDCVKKINKLEGYAGFYRGLVVSLTGMFLYRSLYFGIYDSGLTLMILNGIFPGPMVQFLFGTCVTLAASLAAYPFDVIRRRIMVQQGRK